MNTHLNRTSSKLGIGVIFILTSFSGFAQFSETRELVKRFKVEPETSIDITNKYGKIELKNWEKDSVVIRFKIEINDQKPIKPGKAFDNLDFDISNTPQNLVVKTQADNSVSTIESEFLKFKQVILQTGGSVKIDLEAWLPDNHTLRLENKFGDIIIDDYAGETQILLSNGKLRAGDLLKKASLNLCFADASINSLPDASIVSNYSDIQLKNSGIVKFESKSSTIEIQNSDELTIDSRRDKFRIRLAEKIDAYGNFSHFLLSELRNKGNIRMSYGSLDLEKIVNSFNSIYIESRSADLNLYFSPEARFNFQITESQTDLNLGSEMKVENTEVIDSKENKTRYTGYFGRKMKEDQLVINVVGGETNILAH